MPYYTGVGSRKVPKGIAMWITQLAEKLANHGYVLRSGGADGCDKAFEAGAGSLKEIYYADDANEQAMRLASLMHPAWDRCSDYAKRLHGRNAFQVLGRDLTDPSDFLICWTPDGCKSHMQRSIETGGTGTAISLAERYNVKIYNLHWKQDTREVIDLVKKLES